MRRNNKYRLNLIDPVNYKQPRRTTTHHATAARAMADLLVNEVDNVADHPIDVIDENHRLIAAADENNFPENVEDRDDDPDLNDADFSGDEDVHIINDDFYNNIDLEQLNNGASDREFDVEEDADTQIENCMQRDLAVDAPMEVINSK